MNKHVNVLLIVILGLLDPAPAIAQIYNSSQAPEEENTEERREIAPGSNRETTSGTVPGLYYDPEPGLSPSLREMEGTERSGYINTGGEYEYPYNIDRAWQRGSTPDEIVKVGDVENDPELEGVIEIEELTLREIAANGGADIDTASLKNIGLINNMTVDEFLEMFPDYEGSRVADFPILNESFEEIDGVLENSERINSEAVINNSERRSIARLSQREELQGITLQSIVSGEYDEAVDWTTKDALTRIIQRYPGIDSVTVEEAVPIIDSLVSGDWSRGNERLVDEGEEYLIRELSGVEELEGVPVAEIIGGDYDEAVDIATKEALTKIISQYPELENVSVDEAASVIDDITAGNWDSLKEKAITTAEERAIAELSEVEELEGVPIAEIIRGDYNTAVNEGTRSALEKLVEEYPELEGLPVETISPIISSTINGDWETAKERALSEAEKAVIERLAQEEMFEGIPLEALADGDWGTVIEAGEQALLKEVMRRYPELAQAPIDRLFPMADGIISGDWSLVVQQGKEYAIERGSELIVRELLEAYPELANVPLGALPIEELLVGDIEGLADAALDRVPGIANRYISELGNLSQTPGTMLAIDTAMMLTTGDILGRLDIPFAGDVETPITYVLSGGTRNQVFLPEPCLETDCKHFEVVDVLSGFAGLLTGAGNVQGKAWVQGSSQDVPGGKGFLRWVNNGKERTGVPVWSTDAHVKISLEDIDEGGNGEESTARIWLNFQVCVYPPFLGEHCTPHVFSFATPFKVKSGGVMVVFSRTSPSDLVEYARDRARETEYEDEERPEREDNPDE